MKNKFVFEIKKFSYQSEFMVDFVNTARPYRRLKLVPWKNLDEYRKKFQHLDVDTAMGSVVTNTNDHMLDPSRTDLIYDFKKHQWIKDFIIISGLQEKEISMFEIIYFKEGYRFVPHVDYTVKCRIMFPASNNQYSIQPVDFYDLDQEIKINTEYPNLLDENIKYTHYYSNSCPTVINTHQIHGVRPMKEDRTIFEIGLLISFDEFLNRCETRNLL